MPESPALKHLFGKTLLKRMSAAISDVYPAFDQKRFVGLSHGLESLEMKPRVRYLRDELRRQLPQEYPEALRVLLHSARSGKLTGFDLWPYSDFIQTHGLNDWKLSLDALKELTPLFSSEFAVRPFLKSYPAETLSFLEQCAREPDVDLRRWASEGSRPRLPWGERLHEFVRDPSPTLAILELLKHDPELYVRKSVSNHLNDIAKDHPERVIALLKKWKNAAGGEHQAKIKWIIHRALRTLIKDGHAGALKLIGVSRNARIKLTELKINKKSYLLGDRIEFEFSVRSLSTRPQKLVIDYLIHYMKANQSTSPKVFKLKTVQLPAKSELLIAKRHHLKKITTRVHHAGLHFLEIQVNGTILRNISWKLRL